jgi:hypothetical protein
MCVTKLCVMTRRSAGEGADRSAQQKSKNPTQRHGENHYVLRPAIFPQNKSQTTFIQPFHRDSSHRFHKTIVVRDTSTRHDACTRYTGLHGTTLHHYKFVSQLSLIQRRDYREGPNAWLEIFCAVSHFSIHWSM